MEQLSAHENEIKRLEIIIADARERVANHQAAADALSAAILSINVAESLRSDVEISRIAVTR